MRIYEVTQQFGKQEEQPPAKHKRKEAIKSYKDIDKINKPRYPDQEFVNIKISKVK